VKSVIQRTQDSVHRKTNPVKSATTLQQQQDQLHVRIWKKQQAVNLWAVYIPKRNTVSGVALPQPFSC